jgi:hypothetical protein
MPLLARIGSPTALKASMYAPATHLAPRPTVALEDYDFLRSTYELLMRAPVPNRAAIDKAFAALDAAHERLKAAHEQSRQAHFN